MDAQYVLRLQVPVRDSLAVEEVERVRDLTYYLRRLRFWEVVVLLDAGQELTADDLQQQKLGFSNVFLARFSGIIHAFAIVTDPMKWWPKN